MAIYNFHIFDGMGNCLFSLNPLEETEILYGLLYSLKSFVQRISPTLDLDGDNFFCYSTSQYKLVYYEFPTRVKFVLIISSDVKKDNDFYREKMIQLHKIYVEYHIKNPIKSKTIDSLLFRYHLVTFMTHNL